MSVDPVDLADGTGMKAAKLWVPEKRKFSFTRSRVTGARESIEADYVRFEPAHVVFVLAERIVLAVSNDSVHDLVEEVTDEGQAS